MTVEEKDLCEKMQELEDFSETMSVTMKMNNIVAGTSIRLMKAMARELKKVKEENEKLKAQLTDILSRDAT